MGLETKKKLVPVDKLNQYLEYSQNEDGILVLRRYIHRDIFTTYNSHHKIPKSINFRESYLVHRDDSWLHHSNSETEGSDDNGGDEVIPNHHHQHKSRFSDIHDSSASPNSNFTRRRKSLCFDFGKENKGSGRSSPDDETLSDASSRDYSPPGSLMSSPKSDKRSSFHSSKRGSVNVERSPDNAQSALHSYADLDVTSHMPLQPETCAPNRSDNETAGVGGDPLDAPDGLNPRKLYKKLVSRYRVAADNSASSASAGLLQNMAVPDLGPPLASTVHEEEFDFLLDSSSPSVLSSEPTTPPRTRRQSRYGNLQADPSQNLAVTTKRRSHVSASPESMTRTISSTSCRNSNPSPETIRSTPSSPTAKIDAGIPPVVPKHGLEFQSNANAKTNSNAKQTQSSLDMESSKINVSRSPETGYTRKCSYRKPKRIPDHFTSGIVEHQGLGIINQDDSIVVMEENQNLDGSYKSHKKTPSSFMLPGYNELETKLHVLNPDSRKTSMSSIVPAAPVHSAAPVSAPVKKRHTSYTDFLADDSEVWNARARAFASRSS